jgi:trimethylamine:corrinoid methyltransferase-like protein
MKEKQIAETVKLSFGLDLNEQACAQIVDGAVKLLAETGLGLKSEIARQFLSAFPGVQFKNERAYIDSGTMYDFLEKMKQSAIQPEGKAPFYQGQGFCCFHWADVNKGVIRLPTESDLVKAVRFLDSYGVEQHLPPVAISEYSPKIRDLQGTRICMENSPAIGAPTHTPGETELDYYKQMSNVIGRKIWILAMLIKSPMEFDGRVLEFVIAHKEDKAFCIEMTGGMPSPGSTSPLSFPAAQMQGLAEDLAASFFMHTVYGAYEPPYLRSDPFDMRYLNYCVGSPEYALLDLLSRRLHQYMTGVPRDWAYFHSMSKWPDQQATHERTISCWLQAFAGAVHFKGSGQLAHDEVYSLEQVVIDRSIMLGAERLVKGLKFQHSVEENCRIVEEGLGSGNFLTHDSTLENYTDFYCQRELFPAMNLGQWQKHNEPTPLSMAGEVIEKHLEKNTYRRDQEEIKELRRICEHAAKVLL